MLGLGFTSTDFIVLAIQFICTAYLIWKKNPYEKTTREHEALRICRIALALMVWSFRSGLMGFAFALTAFILAIVGIVKGRTLYGVTIIIGAVCLPVISVLYTFLDMTKVFNQ